MWAVDPSLESDGDSLKSQEESYSPYCPICSSCGEEGCCSPIMCEQHPDGHYCKSNLTHLQFAYHMHTWFINNFFKQLPEDVKKKYDEEWNKAWDEFYKPKPKEDD